MSPRGPCRTTRQAATRGKLRVRIVVGGYCSTSTSFERRTALGSTLKKRRQSGRLEKILGKKRTLLRRENSKNLLDKRKVADSFLRKNPSLKGGGLKLWPALRPFGRLSSKVLQWKLTKLNKINTGWGMDLPKAKFFRIKGRFKRSPEELHA